MTLEGAWHFSMYAGGQNNETEGGSPRSGNPASRSPETNFDFDHEKENKGRKSERVK